MFNYRVVIAQVELLRQIFLAKEKDYAGYAELISKYDGPYKALASWLFARDFDKPQVDDIVSHLDPYIKKGRLKTNDIVVSPSFIKIKNSEPFEELTPFVNFIHGTYPTALARTKESNEATERTPVLIGEGIKIYEVNNPNDSRELASDTSWCIAYPGQNNMWTSYRSGGASSFFIVFDENPPLPNLRKVAIDFNVGGVDLTDITNNTGKTLSNSMDWNQYSEYLENKGIDLRATRKNPETGQEEEILKNKPLNSEEKFFLQYYNYFKSAERLSVEDIKKWSRGLLKIKSDVTPEEYIKSEFRKSENELFIDYSFDESYNKILEIQLRSIKNRPVLRAPIQKDQIVSIVNKTGTKYSADVEENETISLQDLIDGKQRPSQSLSSFDFDSFDNREPITEIIIRNNDSKNYLTKFVGLGYVLPKDVFEYVFDLPDGRELIIQYVDTGITIPEYQIEKIKEIPSLFKTYVRKQLIGLSRNSIQDASILKHLDPNDEKTRNSVLDTLLPKDIINIHSNITRSILNDIDNVPQKWLDLPQLGVLIKRRTDYRDDLAIKVSLCMNVYEYMYTGYNTIENILIFLKDPETLSTFKDEAIAQKYLPAIFEPLFTIEEYIKRWNNIPFTPELREHPKLNKYRALIDSKKSHPLISRGEDRQPIYERLAIILLAGGSTSIATGFENDVNFWSYFINNYNSLLGSVFKNIDYERTTQRILDDNGNEIDEKDQDPDEYYETVENTNYDKDGQRNQFYNLFKKTFSKSILEKPEILQALENNLPKAQVNDIVKTKARSSEILQEYVSESVNSFSELNANDDSYIFQKDNPIIRKLTENGLNVDDYLSKFSKSMQRGLYHIIQLSKWNPELVNQISDSDFSKILGRESSFADHQISWLEQNRPQELVKLFDENPSNILFSYEQRRYVNNIKLRINQPENSIEELKIEEPQAEPEQMPEEPTTAFIKSMVKIANKLDSKKKYELADKLTHILKVKTSQ